MPVLERRVEEGYLDFCLKNGILCLKLKLASESSWPDRTLLKSGGVMFMELKRKGEKPKPLQQFTIDKLTKAGFYAVWSDNLEDAIEKTNIWLRYKL